jgi:uncharacterized protein (DUF1015 family)
MKIKAFQAMRPPAAQAAQVASPPYDVVNRDEVREAIARNPATFLRVVRADGEWDDAVDPYDPAVYRRAAENYADFKARGWLQPAEREALYVYRLQQGGHMQTGLVTVCHVDDYEQGRIKRHEKTRRPAEEDRTRHVDTLNAHTGPVFLTYRDQPAVERLTGAVVQSAPLYDFEGVDGVRHTVWEVLDSAPWVAAFGAIPRAYVADGHHRAASAARVARLRREAVPGATVDDESQWLLAVFFPAGQLKVLPYNRCVRDLNGLDEQAFLKAVAERFSVQRTEQPVPAVAGSVCMRLASGWYALSWPSVAGADPVEALDVSVLQDRLLGPVLGVDDPRQDPRIDFVGGVHGTGGLEQRVATGRAAVAFSLHPVTVNQLMAVADEDRIMPPKSTWFEPKLRSGLLVHELGAHGWVNRPPVIMPVGLRR